MPAIFVEKLKHYTGPLRRSARLQEQQRSRSSQPNSVERPSTKPPAISVEGQELACSSTLLQKRPIDGDGGDNAHQLQRVLLTHNNLAEFNKMAQKKRASKAPVSDPPGSTGEPTSTTTTPSAGFAIQAYKNGILGPRTSKTPENIEEIRTRYAQSRGTASPTESVHEDYVDTVRKARNEATMVFEVGGQLLKRYPKEGYARVLNQAFTSFPKDAGFNSGLSAPQPDFVEGLEMPEYRPFPIDEHIKGAVIDKDDPDSITLPHIAGEWKGRGKNMEDARLQSAYDGAALVYARNQALSYMGRSDPRGYSEVTTFTTDGTTLNLFAHYAAPSPDGDGTLEYHQYPIKSTNLMDSHPGFKDGRRGLRNAQDHARRQSYALRDQLNENWWKHRGALRPLAEGASPALAAVDDGTTGEINTDEAGCVVAEQPRQPAPRQQRRIRPRRGGPLM